MIHDFTIEFRYDLEIMILHALSTAPPIELKNEDLTPQPTLQFYFFEIHKDTNM